MKNKLDQFQIIKKIGEGSFSEVQLVKRIKDNQLYAAKKIQMSDLSQKEKINALNEIRLLASIKNNNIIQYKESFFNQNSKCLYLILEYAQQGDIQQQINLHRNQKSQFSEDQIWHCLIDILQGLNYLHEQDICHRDIKSGNIFISQDNNFKLGDFNISKFQKQQLNYTQIGTPYYAAPEIWKNMPYDTKSDIWSLGCVIYEMASLVTPFNAKSKENLYKKVIRGEYEPIPDNYSYDLQRIINNCLRVNPRIRMSAEELLKTQIIQQKIQKYNYNQNIENKENINLLQTIQLPNNMKNLDNILPQSNYDLKIYENSKYIYGKDQYVTPILKKQMIKNQSVNDFSNLVTKEKNLIDHLSPCNKIKEITNNQTIFQINQQYQSQLQNIKQIQNQLKALNLR